MVLDYRMINKISHKDSMATLLVSETINALAGNSYFSSLDLTSGYQIPMHPNHKEYTTFSDGSDLYQFKELPMVLSNSGQVFK